MNRAGRIAIAIGLGVTSPIWLTLLLIGLVAAVCAVAVLALVAEFTDA